MFSPVDINVLLEVRPWAIFLLPILHWAKQEEEEEEKEDEEEED